MERTSLLRLGIASALVCGQADASPASAQGSARSSATMAVSVEITASCTVAAEPLAFGPVRAAEAASAGATASIEVACGGEVPFSVGLDDGQNYGDGTRRALDPVTGDYLVYEIYSDPARTSRWGASGAETVVDVTAAGGTARLTAYGVITSGTLPVAGRYGDLITVTTNF